MPAILRRKPFSAFVVALVVLSAGARVDRASATPTGNPALDWNLIAQNAIVATKTLPESYVYMSYVQAAVYDAVVAVEGGFESYELDLSAPPGASADAATVAAAYNVLVHYFPAQIATFDAAYVASLDAIPDGPAETAGIAVGMQAAMGIIALRTGDGVGAPITYTPTPAPGVWVPTPPAYLPALTPWLALVRPFMIESPSQFRPGPPPELSSPEWAEELNEIKAIGSATSPYRTAAQTEVARFWATNALAQYNGGYRKIATDHRLGLLDTARLLAMGNMVAADTVIACFDSKYHYGFWRPVTAIRNADTDGNPATTQDLTWTPLLVTPNHPEYLAAHGCVTSGQAEVFSQFLGTDQIDVDLSSTVTGTTRHYATPSQLREEIVDARVWGGLHYRVSGVHGVVLGRRVAHYALKRFFLPSP